MYSIYFPLPNIWTRKLCFWAEHIINAFSATTDQILKSYPLNYSGQERFSTLSAKWAFLLKKRPSLKMSTQIVWTKSHHGRKEVEQPLNEKLVLNIHDLQQLIHSRKNLSRCLWITPEHFGFQALTPFFSTCTNITLAIPPVSITNANTTMMMMWESTFHNRFDSKAKQITDRYSQTDDNVYEFQIELNSRFVDEEQWKRQMS